MKDLNRYHGFARFMVYLACLVSEWPKVLDKHFFDLWQVRLRITQEAMIARGVTMDEVRDYGETVIAQHEQGDQC